MAFPHRPLHVLANGVQDEKGNFFPFKSNDLSPVKNFPAKAGMRYFVHTIDGSMRILGLSTLGAQLEVTATCENVLIYIFLLQLADNTQGTAIAQSHTVDILMDEQTSIDMITGGDSFTGSAIITYAEVTNG